MITVQSGPFRKAIKLAGAVVDRRGTLPILGGLKLKANGALSIEGTDLDTSTRVEIPYEGEPGELFLTDPKAVHAALVAAGGETVVLEQGEKRLALRSGQLTAELATLAPDDHPGSRRIAEQTFGCTLSAATLRQIGRIVPAISTEETRYYLNGINVTLVADWTYRFAATDGHRLMMIDVPLPDAEGALPENFILPRRFVLAALDSFGKVREPLRLTVGHSIPSNQRPPTLDGQAGPLPMVALAAPLGDLVVELGTKLIDCTYPDYRRVIPGDLTHRFRCARADLLQALRSLMPMARERTRAVKFTFTEGRIALQLHSPEIGESRFELAGECMMPADAAIGMNRRYVVELIGSLEGEEVDFAVRGGSGGEPLVVTDPADTAFKAVLMPMRV